MEHLQLNSDTNVSDQTFFFLKEIQEKRKTRTFCSKKNKNGKNGKMKNMNNASNDMCLKERQVKKKRKEE